MLEWLIKEKYIYSWKVNMKEKFWLHNIAEIRCKNKDLQFKAWRKEEKQGSEISSRKGEEYMFPASIFWNLNHW